MNYLYSINSTLKTNRNYIYGDMEDILHILDDISKAMEFHLKAFAH